MKEKALATFRARLIKAGFGVLALGALVAWATVQDSGSPRAPDESVRAARTAPQKWIVVEPDAVGPAAAPAAVVEPPRQVHDGPAGKAIARYLRKIAPAESAAKSTLDYPDLHAASASFQTPDGNLMTLAMQRLSRPVSLESITQSTSLEGLSELPSGTQMVQVRSAMPGGATGELRHLQVVLARASGVSLTLTVVSATPGKHVSWSSVTAADVLVTNAIKTLDVPSVDTLVG